MKKVYLVGFLDSFAKSNDQEIMARAIILSGSYMLFDRHISRPEIDIFDEIKSIFAVYRALSL